MSDYDVRLRRIGGTYYIDAPGFHAATRSREMAFLVLEAVTSELQTLEDESTMPSRTPVGPPTQGTRPEGPSTVVQDTESDE